MGPGLPNLVLETLLSRLWVGLGDDMLVVERDKELETGCVES